MVAGYYRSSLLDANLTKEQHRKKYLNGMTMVNAETYRKCASKLPKKVIDKDGMDYMLRIAPAMFRAVQYINDASYLPGDTTLETERLNKAKESNVLFSQDGSPSSRKELSGFRVLCVQALRSLYHGEEYLVNYGNKYEFHAWSRT